MGPASGVFSVMSEAGFLICKNCAAQLMNGLIILTLTVQLCFTLLKAWSQPNRFQFAFVSCIRNLSLLAYYRNGFENPACGKV